MASALPHDIAVVSKQEITAYAAHASAKLASMAFEPQVGSLAQTDDISECFWPTSECTEVPIWIDAGAPSLQHPPSSLSGLLTAHAHALLAQRSRAGSSVLLPRGSGGSMSPNHDIVVGRRGTEETTLRGVVIRLARKPNPKLAKLGTFCTWRQPSRCNSLPTKAQQQQQQRHKSRDKEPHGAASGVLFDFGFVSHPHEAEAEAEVPLVSNGAPEVACSFAVQLDGQSADDWFFVGVFGPGTTLPEGRAHLVALDLFRIYASVYETPAVSMEAFTRPSISDPLPALMRMAQNARDSFN